MKYILFIFTIINLNLFCDRNVKDEPMIDEARKLMESGRYSEVISLASRGGENRESSSSAELDSLADQAARFLIDFPYTQDDILKLLEADSVYAGAGQLRSWEDSGELEFMWIDGERRYFKMAHRNLYRINDSLRLKIQPDRVRDASLAGICLDEAGWITRLSANADFGKPVGSRHMKIVYTIVTDADIVPEGGIIRCWMPFPDEGSARQDIVRLISASPGNYTISPDTMQHRTIYFEQPAVKGKPSEFRIEFELRTRGLYFDPVRLEEQNHTAPASVIEYTGERLPHISFSREVKELAGSLVTEDMSRYEKVAAFYKWIDKNILWSSAIEYGLMRDIPGYVLKNRRGDCGMQTLVFLSLCRSEGIPARWQSGWMLHPGHVNLHDWSEIYFEGTGWVPVDVSFKLQQSEDERMSQFYMSGIDSYRLIVNNDYARDFYPVKKFPRSEPLDFQRGEVEWEGGNLYFDKWKYNMQVEYLETESK